MKLRSFGAGVVLLLSTLLTSPASAHPHMFLDAQGELLADEDGRLIGLRVSFRVDELTTLFVLEENGVVSLDAPLTPAQSDAIGAGFLEGLAHYDYFTDLRVDDERLSFASASAADVRLDGFQLAATLELTLETPQDLTGRSVEISVYDPTYFAAVDTLGAPVLPTALQGCRSQLQKFQPTSLDSVTLAQLSALSREETPEEPEIGAQFADRSFIACTG